MFSQWWRYPFRIQKNEMFDDAKVCKNLLKIFLKMGSESIWKHLWLNRESDRQYWKVSNHLFIIGQLTFKRSLVRNQYAPPVKSRLRGTSPRSFFHAVCKKAHPKVINEILISILPSCSCCRNTGTVVAIILSLNYTGDNVTSIQINCKRSNYISNQRFLPWQM